MYIYTFCVIDNIIFHYYYYYFLLYNNFVSRYCMIIIVIMTNGERTFIPLHLLFRIQPNAVVLTVGNIY